MEEFLKWIKECSHMRVTADTLINPGPAYVIAVHLVAAAGGAATALIYNGHGTGGEAKIDLSAPPSSSDPRLFWPPLYFDKGIYIDVGSNVTSVLIQYYIPHERE